MSKKIVIAPKSFIEDKDTAMSIMGKYDVEPIFNDTGFTLTEDQLLDWCKDAHGLLTSLDPVTEKVLTECKYLKAISKYGSGLDNIDLEAAKRLGVQVRRAENSNSQSVAEMAIGLMFMLFRNLYYSINSVKSGGWERKLGREVRGKTAGFIGMGSIGRHEIRMCRGLGMKIFAYDPFFSDQEFIDIYNVFQTDFETVLKYSDVLFVCCPLTCDTTWMINKNTLSKMKRTAYLINTSRGPLVNQSDLYDALINGVIAGAASDVFTNEPPLEEDMLLVLLDNFLLASHTAAYTEESIDRTVKKSISNLMEMLFPDQMS